MVRSPSFVYIIHLASLAWLCFESDGLFHSFPVYCRFYRLFETGMPRVLKTVVIPHKCATCQGCRPSLWHMQLSFSIRRSSSPLSSTALLLKYCFRVLSAFWASTIYFTVRGYISSSSLRFVKHWFNRIVLSSSESPCLSGTKILSTSTIFG